MGTTCESKRYGFSGMLFESGISPRIIFVAAPVSRKYQSLGIPSKVPK